jgi:8-oxo-dGTP pyrophosphatase MutT (NUDIX family)
MDMKDLKWKTLKSEYLFKDLWFTVRQDTCERPDGKIVTPYYVYEFPTWVNAVAITTEGKIILERQYRHGSGEVGYEIPGGCVDDTDATNKDAVARELLEETGYVFDNYEYLGRISSNPSTNNNWMHMYLATGGKLIQDQNLDPNEEIEVHLFSMQELKEMIRNNELTQSMHVTTIFYALMKLGEVKM